MATKKLDNPGLMYGDNTMFLEVGGGRSLPFDGSLLNFFQEENAKKKKKQNESCLKQKEYCLYVHKWERGYGYDYSAELGCIVYERTVPEKVTMICHKKGESYKDYYNSRFVRGVIAQLADDIRGENILWQSGDVIRSFNRDEICSMVEPYDHRSGYCYNAPVTSEVLKLFIDYISCAENQKLDETGIYKLFCGLPLIQIPLIFEKGRSLLSIESRMRKELEFWDNDDDLSVGRWEISYVSGDAVLFHPDGRIKICPASELVRGLTLESKLKNEALVLPDGVYEDTEGREYKIGELADWGVIERECDFITNLFLNVLIKQTRQTTLERYRKYLLKTREIDVLIDGSIQIYLHNPEDVPTMRLLALTPRRIFNRRFNWTIATTNLLDYSQLIGKLPESDKAGS